LNGPDNAEQLQSRVRLPLTPHHRLVRVTEPTVACGAEFRLLVPPVGFVVAEPAGMPIASDGVHVWTAPYVGTVLVTLGTENLKPAVTAARPGRLDDGRKAGLPEAHALVGRLVHPVAGL
jgi:hypothetical protein